VKNILLTGKPKSGKSTLLRKLIAKIPNKVGFVTNEVVENEGRVGFEIETSSGERTLLAHINFDKSQSVGKYGLNLNNLNEVLPTVENFKDEVLYLDEIGEMELKSEPFVELTRKYLDSENLCIATITSVYEDDFTREVKNRDDVTLFEIMEDNRDGVYEDVLKFLKEKSGIKILVSPNLSKTVLTSSTTSPNF
jgi:nucleoside-triphosphatase